MTTAIGYVRVSSKKDEQATSPDRQRALIESECQRQGWQLARLFEDRKSGKNLDRPDFRALERYLREHGADLVVAVDMSRWGRDVFYYLQFEREVLEPLGVELWLVNGINGQSTQVRFMRLIEMGMAEMYRLELAEKTAQGLDHLARKHGGWGNRIPYGYASSKRERPDEPCILVPVPEQADVVRRIYDKLAEGWSYHRTTRLLSDEGIPAPEGGPWSPSTVKRIGHSRVYLGELTHNGEVLPGAHEPLVERSVWEKARRRPERRSGRTRAGRYLLPNVHTTHWRRVGRYAGAPMRLFGENKGQPRYRLAMTTNRVVYAGEAQDEGAATFPSSVLAPPLEYAVIQKLIGLAEDSSAPAFWPEVLDEFSAQIDGLKREAAHERRLLARLKRERERKALCLERALEYGLDKQATGYAAELDAMDGRIAEAERLLSACEADLPAGQPPLAMVERVNVLRMLWERQDRPALQAYLKGTLAGVCLRREGDRLIGKVQLHAIPGVTLPIEKRRGTSMASYSISLPVYGREQLQWLAVQTA